MSADAPLLSLLITTKDRREDLLQTLRAMLPMMPARHEVTVFDDGSTDGTAEAVARTFPHVKVIRRPVSGGLIPARNQLLAEARGQFALSLDDDAEIVTGDFSSKVLRYFAENPRCGVLALSIHWGKDLPVSGTNDSADPSRVNSFVGCGHVWRMEAWRSIPPYPEWFEFHGEEDHAALNLLKHGWEVHYLPEVVVHHRVDLEARRADRSFWRYRRQLRAGILLMLLFYPWRVLPRYLAYSYWTQLRLRLFREHDWKALLSLGWVAGKVVTELPRIARERSPLTSTEWAQWRRLPRVVVYRPSEKKA